MMIRNCFFVVIVGFAALTESYGAPAFDPIFGDGMVLQRDKPIRVWGTAGQGEKVMVSFGEHEVGTVAEKGHWEVSLPPMEASPNPISLKLTGGGKTIGLSDVLVGEVWLCSGQSNMVWPLSKCVDGPAEAEAAKDTLIRVNRTRNWELCVGETAAKTSGVAYYFARQLRENNPDVPVGLIVRAVGGTPIEYWTPMEALERNNYAQSTMKRFSGETEEGKEWMAFSKAEAKWKAATRKNRQKKTKGEKTEPVGKKPQFEGGPDAIVLGGIYSKGKPGNLWRKMIKPVVGYTIGGALWYQGERNSKAGTENAEAYDELLATMITGWRAAWGQGDFRFLIVQLPSYAGGSPNWAVIQKNQASAVRMVKNADYVSISDLPDGGLHPKDKKPVGERLAAKAFSN